MANNKSLHTESFEAVTDLSTKQFYFVKLSSDRRVAISDGLANLSIGVLQNKPAGTTAEPRQAEVMVAGRTKVVAGGDLVAGDPVKVDSSGRAVTATPGSTAEWIVGVVLEAAGTVSAGQLIEILLNCMNPHRTGAS